MNGLPEKTTKILFSNKYTYAEATISWYMLSQEYIVVVSLVVFSTTTMYSCDSIYHDIVASAYVYLFENNI
jgi:hypothetical protein